MINYNNRIFRSKSNALSGEVDHQTVFYYHQEGHILNGTYSGGQILKGQMLGLINPNGTLKFNYQHVNIDGQLRAGSCVSTPEISENGAIVLHESWQWMDGNQERGESIVEEVLE